MKLHQQSPNGWYKFWCPGCEEHHWFNPLTHQVTGDLETPTVSHDIVIHWKEWQPGEKGALKGIRMGRCSCKIEQGILIYNNDTTHSLVGKKVPMVDWER